MKLFAVFQSPEEGRPATRGEKAFAVIMLSVIAFTVLGCGIQFAFWPDAGNLVILLVSVAVAVFWIREQVSIVRTLMPSAPPADEHEER